MRYKVDNVLAGGLDGSAEVRIPIKKWAPGKWRLDPAAGFKRQQLRSFGFLSSNIYNNRDVRVGLCDRYCSASCPIVRLKLYQGLGRTYHIEKFHALESGP